MDHSSERITKAGLHWLLCAELMGSMDAYLQAGLQVHPKEGGRHCGHYQRKAGNRHYEVDADDSVSGGIQLHAPHLPHHLHTQSLY